MIRRIAILGSTGSIGTQALDVIRRHKERFVVDALTAGQNADLLIEQALEYVPRFVVIADETRFAEVRDALSRLPIQVLAGTEALSEVAVLPETDIVLTAMVGFSGLLPTIAAVKAGKKIALANKETLVVAGALITKLAKLHQSEIYPVDSEHSAIFQCLEGENHATIEKIILTASGGPFRGMNADQLKHVTRREALNHPNWIMGNKITIDSATLMNKGLEMIEATWLFSIESSQIEVIIHPQSVIHSFVQFKDGSIKAQLSLPDMRLPIQYALGYPERFESDFPRFNFRDFRQFTFEEPDIKVFRNLPLAFRAVREGGNMPCILNAANEIVVEAFLTDNVRFSAMPDIIEKVMDRMALIKDPTLEDYKDTDREAREYTRKMVTGDL
jgi:1-deoxy-D-xylulose-5-phosphate reductoisomerase